MSDVFGPWTMDRWGSGVVDRTGVVVANLVTWNNDIERRKANGLLIANAPDLAVSLRELVTEYDKRIAEYEANGDKAVADITRQWHGKRMETARRILMGAGQWP